MVALDRDAPSARTPWSSDTWAAMTTVSSDFRLLVWSSRLSCHCLSLCDVPADAGIVVGDGSVREDVPSPAVGRERRERRGSREDGRTHGAERVCARRVVDGVTTVCTPARDLASPRADENALTAHRAATLGLPGRATRSIAMGTDRRQTAGPPIAECLLATHHRHGLLLEVDVGLAADVDDRPA